MKKLLTILLILFAGTVFAQQLPLPDTHTECAIGGFLWKPDDTNQLIIDVWPQYELTNPDKVVGNQATVDKEATEFGFALWGELKKIKGVRGVAMGQFQLAITKWPLFSQQQVEKNVLEVLEAVKGASLVKKK